MDPKDLLAKYEPKQGKTLKLDRQMCQARFSPCGKFLFAGMQDGTLRRWDLTSEDMPEWPPVTGHGGWVQAICFHPDAKRLYSADSWGRLCAWNYADPQPKPIWSVENAHNGWIRQLAISPDGSKLASCGIDMKVRTWSADDGQKQLELGEPGQEFYSLAFHPDGKSLLSGDLLGVIRQYDAADGKETRQFDAKILYLLSRLQDVGGVRVLAFDREGKTLLAAGTKPSVGANVQGTPHVLFFDWETGQLKHTFKHGADGDGFVYDAAFHADGFVMAVTSGNPGAGKFFFFRPEEAQPFYLNTKMPNCHTLAVHPNGWRLAVSSTNGGSNGNGRQLKNGVYEGNFSPLNLWDLPHDG
jgi:WD40 repeat protein